MAVVWGTVIIEATRTLEERASRFPLVMEVRMAWAYRGEDESIAIVWARTPTEAVDILDERISIAAHELVRIEPSYFTLRRNAGGMYDVDGFGPVMMGTARVQRAWLCPRGDGVFILVWAATPIDARRLIAAGEQARLIPAVHAWVLIDSNAHPPLELAEPLIEQLDNLVATQRD